MAFRIPFATEGSSCEKAKYGKWLVDEGYCEARSKIGLDELFEGFGQAREVHVTPGSAGFGIVHFLSVDQRGALSSTRAVQSFFLFKKAYEINWKIRKVECVERILTILNTTILQCATVL